MLSTIGVELVKEYSFQILILFFRIFLLTCLFVLCFLVYYQYSERGRVLRRMPCLKLHFWDVLGHVTVSFRNRTGLARTLHTYHVYDLQAFCGYIYLHRGSSILSVWELNKPFVIAFKADAVKTILNHSTQLKKAWFYEILHSWLGTGLLTSHGDKWKQRRRLLTPTFHFDILKNFLPGINHQSKVFVKVLKETLDKEWVNFTPYVSRCSLDIICETTLGVKVGSQLQKNSEYLKAVGALSEEFFHRLLSPWLWPQWLFPYTSNGRRTLKNLQIVHRFTRKAILDRKAEIIKYGTRKEIEEDGIYKGHKKLAFLDFLLEEHLINQSFTEEDIREEVDTFTFEGHDTTAMGMTWATYLLGLHPDIQKKVHEELDSIFGDDTERDVTVEDLKEMRYLECVLKESQRLYPSVPFYGRQVTEDINFKGYRIPKGVTCSVFAYMLHRDPDVFPNPEVFDPDRFLPENSEQRDAFAYVPFSAGPRNCIGQRFAMMEEKTVMSTLLRNYTVRSLDHRDVVQVVADVILRPVYDIRIQIRPRKR